MIYAFDKSFVHLQMASHHREHVELDNTFGCGWQFCPLWNSIKCFLDFQKSYTIKIGLCSAHLIRCVGLVSIGTYTCVQHTNRFVSQKMVDRAINILKGHFAAVYDLGFPASIICLRLCGLLALAFLFGLLVTRWSPQGREGTGSTPRPVQLIQ